HHGQGKWYPGEPLPRWAFSSYWRTDGIPIWNDLDLVADHRINYGFGEKEAEAYIKELTRNLDLPLDHLRAAYEDLFYYLWKERRLPMNVGVDDPRLTDPLERKTIAKVFDQGLGSTVGYLLPLTRGFHPDEWLTGPWFTQDEEFFLAPGNHPMGYRLPIDGLPWAKRVDHPILEPHDPSIPREPFSPERFLPPGAHRRTGAPHSQIRGQSPGHEAGDRPGDRPLSPQQRKAMTPPQLGESAAGIVRTGLCVEPRDGRLHVFMPPLVKAEHYLELVGALEETAKTVGTPIRIEGYKPPSDPRLASFSVTPDPGVIEVNIHPSTNWKQLRERTRAIYEEARTIGLGTEKFMQDGRHSGTGGGNHIVVGGSTPLDSPFLRRPDLLPSLIRTFNNHPSLSYLFSGLFVGPTSQAPRLDESRNETLYELETALDALPREDTTQENTQWLVDRILRNHMVDLTGNTHRVELCIDKLFSPDSSSGRLGLVEMRGFEMPPHADMSLAQQLLIRGLITRFWDEPCTHKLVRWGTSIHDQWMLPHFIKDDLHEIIADLNDYGLQFDPAWFDPHHEFRFPIIGEMEAKNIRLELRQAIEPWHVLGEEQGSGGTSRYVDSSVERVQVKLNGLTDSRHILSCNGVGVPLHPTGRKGEFVAGIRFRAWSPYSALHPTKPINSPLTFDLVDTWNQRSIAGCQYHVTHPGGRSFDDFPLNAFVAESRRRSRFTTLNRTPGPLDPVTPPPSKDYPMTLDLQRFTP
ncbi:MAG: transglutaminase family protein, partial [Verrucomicrobiales bacterium]